MQIMRGAVLTLFSNFSSRDTKCNVIFFDIILRRRESELFILFIYFTFDYLRLTLKRLFTTLLLATVLLKLEYGVYRVLIRLRGIFIGRCLERRFVVRLGFVREFILLSLGRYKNESCLFFSCYKFYNRFIIFIVEGGNN